MPTRLLLPNQVQGLAVGVPVAGLALGVDQAVYVNVYAVAAVATVNVPL